jgi:hypothetical protein
MSAGSNQALASGGVAEQRRAEHDARRDLADHRRLPEPAKCPAEQARQDDDADQREQDMDEPARRCGRYQAMQGCLCGRAERLSP